MFLVEYIKGKTLRKVLTLRLVFFVTPSSFSQAVFSIFILPVFKFM